MTSDLEDLIDSSFYLMYHLRIPPSEVDKLSTYEMRAYIRRLNERVTAENEENSSMTKVLGNLFRNKRK